MHARQTVVDVTGEALGVVVGVHSSPVRGEDLLAIRTSLFGRPRLVPTARAVERWPDVAIPYDRQLVLSAPCCSRRGLRNGAWIRVRDHYHTDGDPKDKLRAARRYDRAA